MGELGSFLVALYTDESNYETILFILGSAATYDFYRFYLLRIKITGSREVSIAFKET